MRIELYRDRQKLWRWRAVARNGKIVADSGEGYTRKGGAWKGFCALAHAKKIEVVVKR